MKGLLRKLPIILILGLTLVLVVFIGYGETRRTYYTYRIETTVLQSDTFLDIIEPFIQAGFPLTMYSGYDSMAQAFFESNPDIQNILVSNAMGTEIFQQGNTIPPDQSFQSSTLELDSRISENVHLEESRDFFVISRKLTAPRGEAGMVQFHLSKNVSQQEILESYKPVFWALGFGFIIIAIVFDLITRKQNRKTSGFLIKFIYLVIFFLLTSVVTYTTVRAYNSGVRGKANAVGALLAQRLSPAVTLGIDLADMEGVDSILSEFRDRYAMIDSVSLITVPGDTSNSIILYDSDPQRKGGNFSGNSSRHMIFDAPLEERSTSRLLIKISVPRREITRTIFDSLITFSALLVGCGLIAMVFLNVGLAYTSRLSRTSGSLKSQIEIDESLQLIKAAYFLVVFISSMAVPFLPLLVSELNNGSISSMPFVLFYLAFALVLIPSGNMASKGHIKSSMAIGFLAQIFGGLLIAFSKSLPPLTIGQVLAGAGQGFFLIGFQSYVLSVTPLEKRTQGAAIKVIARNSALIAGTAIGALLYVFMGYRNLFILSAIISVLGFLYLYLMVPPITRNANISTKRLELKSFYQVFKDKGFLKVLLLTGIPAKMGITGVVSFAVPLLLGSMHFSPEAIGRFLMLFYIVSMLTTRVASRRVDNTGNTILPLFFSALVGGLGMVIMGYQTLVFASGNSLITFVALMCIAVSNGLISAPIVTQITKTFSSEKVGFSSIIAVYTFLERFGHFLGPGIISYLIVLSGNKTAQGIGIFGLITVALGIIFILLIRRFDFREDCSRAIATKPTSRNKRELIRYLGPVVAMSIQIKDLPDTKDWANDKEAAQNYRLTLQHLHTRFASRKGDYLRSSGGRTDVRWPANRKESVPALCQRAFKLRQESLHHHGLPISTVGIHLYEAALFRDKTFPDPISLRPQETFSSRLLDLNTQYGTSIIISHTVKEQLNKDFHTRFLDVCIIPGTQSIMPIYELFGIPDNLPSQQQIQFGKIYENCLHSFRNGQLQKAQRHIQYLFNKVPENPSVRQLYRRILDTQENSWQ